MAGRHYKINIEETLITDHYVSFKASESWIPCIPTLNIIHFLCRKQRTGVNHNVSRMQTDVTDEEMALRYESLVESMKKFAKKRVNHNAVETTTKRKFLKPQD
uniref:Uncharacterized protein n=1 Tax=Sander lucioperca TaxID=283035 RepID=A0A8C9ZGT7_SANLU